MSPMTPRSTLMTVPNAPITVTNLSTGATEPREPNSRFGTRHISAIFVDGNKVNVEFGTYRWCFECASREEAEKRAKEIAVVANR